MEFKDAIKKARKFKKMTLNDFGEFLNVSGRTISNYEKGVSIPHRADILRKTADILRCSVDDIIEGNIKTEKTSKDLMDIIGEMSGLFAGEDYSEEDKDKIMHAIMMVYLNARVGNKKSAPKKYREKDK